MRSDTLFLQNDVVGCDTEGLFVKNVLNTKAFIDLQNTHVRVMHSSIVAGNKRGRNYSCSNRTQWHTGEKRDGTMIKYTTEKKNPKCTRQSQLGKNNTTSETSSE